MAEHWWDNLDPGLKLGIIENLYETFNKTKESFYEISEYTQKIINEQTESVVEYKYKIEKLESDIISKDVQISCLENTNTDEIRKIYDYISRDNKTNKELGEEGENAVDNLIHNNYENYEIIDTSREKNKGDRILITEGVNIVLEVKNVSQNSLLSNLKSYRTQLLNDVTILRKTNYTNVGILVSVNDITFNNKNVLKYEIVDTEFGEICMFYCSNVLKCPEIFVACTKLCVLISKLLYRTNNDNQIIQSKINIVVPIINNIIINMSDNNQILDKLLKSNKKCTSEIMNILSILKPEESKTEIVLEIYNNMKEIHKNVTRNILTKQLELAGYSKSYLTDVGGIRKIETLYNKSLKE